MQLKNTHTKKKKCTTHSQDRHDCTIHYIHNACKSNIHIHGGVPVGQLMDVKCHLWHRMWVNSLLGSDWALSPCTPRLCLNPNGKEFPTYTPTSPPRLPLVSPPPTGTDWIPFSAGDKAEHVTRSRHHYRHSNGQHTVRVSPVAFKLFQSAIRGMLAKSLIWWILNS